MNHKVLYDKLFMLSFVHSFKAIPEEYKFNMKTDLINTFRKWKEKLGYDQYISTHVMKQHLLKIECQLKIFNPIYAHIHSITLIFP